MREKKDKAEKEMSQRKEAYKAGKMSGISGRELFEFNPEYVQGDDEEAGDDDVITLRRNEVSGRRGGYWTYLSVKHGLATFDIAPPIKA